MNIDFKEGRVFIDMDVFDDIIDNMSGAEKIAFIEQLSCDEDVIRHVANQIVDGYTELGNRGSRVVGGSANPTRALDEAHRRIAQASSRIAQEEITALQSKIKQMDEDFNRLYLSRQHLDH